MDDLSDREPSSAVADRVEVARAAARHRWQDLGWATNAEVPGPLLRHRSWRPSRSAMDPVERALELGELTARGCDRVLKLAWTLADLAGQLSPGRAEIESAVQLRTGRGLVSA
jgi:magnesium chelatase family protein